VEAATTIRVEYPKPSLHLKHRFEKLKCTKGLDSAGSRWTEESGKNSASLFQDSCPEPSLHLKPYLSTQDIHLRFGSLKRALDDVGFGCDDGFGHGLLYLHRFSWFAVSFLDYSSFLFFSLFFFLFSPLFVPLCT
jgi:hypothetical protein